MDRVSNLKGLLLQCFPMKIFPFKIKLFTFCYSEGQLKYSKDRHEKHEETAF